MILLLFSHGDKVVIVTYLNISKPVSCEYIFMPQYVRNFCFPGINIISDGLSSASSW